MHDYLLAFNARRLALLTIGLGCALVVIYLLQIDQGYRLLQKEPPHWVPLEWMRAIGCAAVGFVLAVALRPDAPDRRRYGFGEGGSAAMIVAIGGSIFFAVLTTIVLTLDPPLLFQLVNEYAPGEMISEASLFAAALMLVVAAKRMHGAEIGGFRYLPASLILFAAAFVVAFIAAEEISYGQKFLQWSTPAAFAGNLQAETNIHNFYTHRFEFFYYSGAVAVFLVLPFLWPNHVGPRLFKVIDFYVPPRYFLIPGALLTPFLFETWVILPFQIYFFTAVFILFLCWARATDRSTRLLLAVTALTMIAGQTISLVHGHQMQRSHDLTEVRELLISTMILAYALLMARRASDRDWA